MLFGKYIDKTHHKNLVPGISGLGSVVYKLRIVVPPIFAAVIVAGYFISSNCPYVYDISSSKTDRQNETQIAQQMIDDTFGAENMAALVFPAGDYEKEKNLIKELELTVSFQSFYMQHMPQTTRNTASLSGIWKASVFRSLICSPLFTT